MPRLIEKVSKGTLKKVAPTKKRCHYCDPLVRVTATIAFSHSVAEPSPKRLHTEMLVRFARTLPHFSQMTVPSQGNLPPEGVAATKESDAT